TFYNCQDLTFNNIHFNTNGVGIRIQQSDSIQINECTFNQQNFTATSIDSSSIGQIKNCTFEENKGSSVVSIQNSEQIVFENNVLAYNEAQCTDFVATIWCTNTVN